MIAATHPLFKHTNTPDEHREFAKGKFEISHVVMVGADCPTVATNDGAVAEMRAGDKLYVPGQSRESSVVGEDDKFDPFSGYGQILN